MSVGRKMEYYTLTKECKKKLRIKIVRTKGKQVRKRKTKTEKCKGKQEKCHGNVCSALQCFNREIIGKGPCWKSGSMSCAKKERSCVCGFWWTGSGWSPMTGFWWHCGELPCFVGRNFLIKWTTVCSKSFWHRNNSPEDFCLLGYYAL